jgi:hypothetical protein
MDTQQSAEGAAKQWAEAHPAEAEQVRTILMGSFVPRECHKDRLPDDMICPTCFRHFVSEVKAIDQVVAGEMESNHLTWTKGWIKGALD